MLFVFGIPKSRTLKLIVIDEAFIKMTIVIDIGITGRYDLKSKLIQF